MKSQEMILDVMRQQGRADALDLRSRAAEMDGTAIIAEEAKAPEFDPEKDYSGWPVGAPVRDGEQVYKLLQPHNAAHYPGVRPANSPTLWSVTHTKDPARAKPWKKPDGTSGMYMTGECYLAEDGVTVYRALRDSLVYDAAALPEAWEALT